MQPLKRTGLVTVIIIICLAIFAAGSQPRTKQSTSTIIGTVLDVNDARVVHAKIKIENAHFKWEGESDNAGDFTANVPVGTYRIFVNANGFRRFESPFLNAKQNVTEMVNLHLEVLVIIDKIEIPNTKRP